MNSKTDTLKEKRNQLLTTELGELKVRYSQLNVQHSQLNAYAEWLQKEWNASKAHAVRQQDGWDAAKAKIYELECRTHSEIDRLNNELEQIYSSTSWRITRPLRFFWNMFKWLLFKLGRFVRILIQLPKKILRSILLAVMGKILYRPRFKYVLNALFKYFPFAHNRLHMLASNAGLFAENDKVDSCQSKNSIKTNVEGEHFNIIKPKESNYESNIEVFIARIYKEIELRDEN